MTVVSAAGGVSKLGVLVVFLVSTLMNLLSMTGIADSIVKWGCFLDFHNLVVTYQQLKHALFAVIPVHIPNVVQDYATVAGSFGLMLNGYSFLTTGRPFPLGYGPPSRWARILFAIAFYLVPWLFILLTWVFLDRQTKSLKRQIHISDIPELRPSYATREATLRREQFVYRSILVVYPVACLVVLLLFSDVTYKVFGVREVGGIAFNSSCAVR